MKTIPRLERTDKKGGVVKKWLEPVTTQHPTCRIFRRCTVAAAVRCAVIRRAHRQFVSRLAWEFEQNPWLRSVFRALRASLSSGGSPRCLPGAPISTGKSMVERASELIREAIRLRIIAPRAIRFEKDEWVVEAAAGAVWQWFVGGGWLELYGLLVCVAAHALLPAEQQPAEPLARLVLARNKIHFCELDVVCPLPEGRLLVVEAKSAKAYYAAQGLEHRLGKAGVSRPLHLVALVGWRNESRPGRAVCVGPRRFIEHVAQLMRLQPGAIREWLLA